MHYCERCGEELTFNWGDDPKRCDYCFRRMMRHETGSRYWDYMRDRAVYHKRRRQEDDDLAAQQE